MSARGHALRRLVDATASRRRLIVLSTLLGTGAVLAAIGLLTASGYLISRAAQRPEILSLTVVIVGVRFFGTIRALLRYAERLASHELAFRSLADLRVKFFQHLIPLVPAPTGPGMRRADLMRRFVGDVERLQDLYLRALTPPVIAAATGLVAVLIATLILPETGLVLALMMLAGGLLAPLATRFTARTAGRRQSGLRAQLSGDLLELLEGAPELIVAGRSQDWLERCRRGDAQLRRLQRRDAVAAGLAVGLSTGLAVAAAIAVTAVAIPAVEAGRLDGVMLAALALLALASFEAITPLGTAAANIDACADAALRIEDVIERRPAVSFPTSAARPLGAATTETKARSAPRLTLRGLSFGYGDAPPLFRGLDLDLSPGTVTALVGPSGSGKTSLAELLVRFREPRAGSIEVAGRSLKSLTEEELRDTIRLAAQDAHVFTATLRENLALGSPKASDEEMREALNAVGLGAWLNGLKEGLNAYLGEAGIALSGGQRQRIAAARLMLSRVPIQIYDEPTAHLDGEARDHLLETLIRAARESNHTLLIISHEIESTASFDQVVDLDRYRP